MKYFRINFEFAFDSSAEIESKLYIASVEIISVIHAWNR